MIEPQNPDQPISFERAVEAARRGDVGTLGAFVRTSLGPDDPGLAEIEAGPDQIRLRQDYYNNWRSFHQKVLVETAVFSGQKEALAAVIPAFDDKTNPDPTRRTLCSHALRTAVHKGDAKIVSHILDHYKPDDRTLKWAFFMAADSPARETVEGALFDACLTNPSQYESYKTAQNRAEKLAKIAGANWNYPSFDDKQYISTARDPEAVLIIARTAIYKNQPPYLDFMLRHISPDQYHECYYDAVLADHPDLATKMYEQIKNGSGYDNDHPFPDLRVPNQDKDYVLTEGLKNAVMLPDSRCLAPLTMLAEPPYIHEALSLAMVLKQPFATAAIVAAIDRRLEMIPHAEAPPLKKVRSDGLIVAIHSGSIKQVEPFLTDDTVITPHHLYWAGQAGSAPVLERLLANVAVKQCMALEQMTNDDAALVAELSLISPSFAAQGVFWAAEQAYDYLPKQASSDEYGIMLCRAANASRHDFCQKLQDNHPDIAPHYRFTALKEAALNGHRETFDVVAPGVNDPVDLTVLAMSMAESSHPAAQKSVGWLLEKTDCRDLDALSFFVEQANLQQTPPPYLGAVLGQVAKTSTPALDFAFADMLTQQKGDARKDFVSLYKKAGASARVSTLFDVIDRGENLYVGKIARHLTNNPPILVKAADYAIQQQKPEILAEILSQHLPKASYNELLCTAVMTPNIAAIGLLKQYGANPEADEVTMAIGLLSPQDEKTRAVKTALYLDNPVANQNAQSPGLRRRQR